MALAARQDVGHTLVELLTLYDQEVLPTRAETTCTQQKKLHGRWCQEMGHLLLDEVTPEFLRTWRDSLTAQGYAPGTVRRYLESLSGPLTAAVQDYGWLTEHPMRKVRKPKATPGRVRCLTQEERAALLREASCSRNPHLGTIIQLALATGARRNEIRSLQWRHVDLAQGAIRFQQTSRRLPERYAGLASSISTFTICAIPVPAIWR